MSDIFNSFQHIKSHSNCNLLVCCPKKNSKKSKTKNSWPAIEESLKVTLQLMYALTIQMKPRLGRNWDKEQGLYLYQKDVLYVRSTNYFLDGISCEDDDGSDTEDEEEGNENAQDSDVDSDKNGKILMNFRISNQTDQNCRRDRLGRRR